MERLTQNPSAPAERRQPPVRRSFRPCRPGQLWSSLGSSRASTPSSSRSRRIPTNNSEIGEALGIEGPEQSGPDLAAIEPQVKVTVSGGAVLVGWGGHGADLDMIRLEVGRGGGQGFALLATDTHRAMYYVGDHSVGQ